MDATITVVFVCLQWVEGRCDLSPATISPVALESRLVREEIESILRPREINDTLCNLNIRFSHLTKSQGLALVDWHPRISFLDAGVHTLLQKVGEPRCRRLSNSHSIEELREVLDLMDTLD